MVCIAKRISAGLTAALFAAFSVTVPITATAAVSSAVAVMPGYVNGTYKASAPLSLVSNAFNVNSVVQVGGKAVVVPAAMRLASNAPNFAVAAIRLNPTALVVGSVAAWLLTQGIQLIDGQLKKAPSGPSANYGDWSGTYLSGDYHGSFTSALQEALQNLAAQNGTGNCPNGPDGSPYCPSVASAGCTGAGLPDFYTCTGYAGGQLTFTRTNPYSPNPQIATDTDFAPLQVANLPDAVAGELIQKTPLPVTQPQLQPVDVPISEPRIDPVTNRPVRDYARITPSTNPETPLNVDTQTYTKDVETSGGTPAPTTDKFPDDYNREVTQKEISDELKAKTAPEPTDWEKSVNDKKTELEKQIKDKIDEIPTQQQADKSLWFSWVWTPPVGSCQPIAGGTVRGASFAGWNICGPVEIVRDAMGYLLAVFSSIVIYSQLFRGND